MKYWYSLISECFDCGEVDVKFFNNAQKQSSRAGRYIETYNVNTKQAWKQVNGSNALWHTGSEWIFGSVSKIGGTSGVIFAYDDEKCPQNVSTWKFHTSKNFYRSNEYTTVPSSDVLFECVEFTGNHRVFLTDFLQCSALRTTPIPIKDI